MSSKIWKSLENLELLIWWIPISLFLGALNPFYIKFTLLFIELSLNLAKPCADASPDLLLLNQIYLQGVSPPWYFREGGIYEVICRVGFTWPSTPYIRSITCIGFNWTAFPPACSGIHNFLKLAELVWEHFSIDSLS